MFFDITLGTPNKDFISYELIYYIKGKKYTLKKDKFKSERSKVTTRYQINNTLNYVSIIMIQSLVVIHYSCSSKHISTYEIEKSIKNSYKLIVDDYKLCITHLDKKNKTKKTFIIPDETYKVKLGCCFI